ncbi:MAG TPA: DNRLRE domain-containing protein [Williamwhitmania sp.]|nr:DNRLRE domain-containing protein [Williamwhitmania sp.]
MKNLNAVISFALIMGLFSCSTVKNEYKAGKVLTIQPGPNEGTDAFIENWDVANYPNRNWGDCIAFTAVAWTGHGDPQTVRSLISFNLTNIPKKAKIRRATLSLYAVSTPQIGAGHSTLGGPNDFVLNKIISPWDENSVTWNTQPQITSKYEVILPASQFDNQDYLNIDITDMVQEMIKTPSKNFGLMIRLLNENNYRRVIFGSSDNPNSQKRPKLVIEF